MRMMWERMEIPVRGDVWCEDRLIGTSYALIVDWPRRTLTQVVVKEPRRPHISRLVPFGMIASASGGQVHLRCTDADSLDSYIETEVVRLPTMEPIDRIPDRYRRTAILVPTERISPEEVEIHDDTEVTARDGRTGRIEALVADRDGTIEEVVLRSGLVHRAAAVADDDLVPVSPAVIGIAPAQPDTAHIEGAHLLADEARSRLTADGFTDDEIMQWADDFVSVERSGDVNEFLSWIEQQERRRLPRAGTA
ncbi:MAG: hypothetical protein ABR518_05680 [Actinomycetota bacterium]